MTKFQELSRALCRAKNRRAFCELSIERDKERLIDIEEEIASLVEQINILKSPLREVNSADIAKGDE